MVSDNENNELYLIKQSQQGDKMAFESLVKLNTNYVYNLAYYLCAGDKSSVDDLVQNVFLRAYRAIKKFEGRSQFKTWLHRITVNLWKNMVRTQKRKKYFQHQSIDASKSEEEAGKILEISDQSETPLEKVEQQETYTLIRTAIDKLPEAEKQVVILKDIEDYAYEEIAHICNIPLGTVKSRLSRARRMLREMLAEKLR